MFVTTLSRYIPVLCRDFTIPDSAFQNRQNPVTDSKASIKSIKSQRIFLFYIFPQPRISCMDVFQGRKGQQATQRIKKLETRHIFSMNFQINRKKCLDPQPEDQILTSFYARPFFVANVQTTSCKMIHQPFSTCCLVRQKYFKCPSDVFFYSIFFLEMFLKKIKYDFSL